MANLVLVVNALFGFKMETFKFLNMAQTHGFLRWWACSRTWTSSKVKSC